MKSSTVSKLANSTFTSQFFPPEPQQNNLITPIQNNRVELLHSLVTLPMLQPKDSQTPLLLHTAFHNSSPSAVYLLRRGVSLESPDSEGKTVFHMCAYTGHIQVLKSIRIQMKLRGVRKLNQSFMSLLTKDGYKRTDAKSGKLKNSVSQGRRKVFDKMQQSITESYQTYVSDLLRDTQTHFTATVKNTNRNPFHLACLNRYQRCYNIMEYMFEELGEIRFLLDPHSLEHYQQVNQCFHTEEERIDPRLFQDTLPLVQEFILPIKLEEIRKGIALRAEELKDIILRSKDKDGHNPLHIASKNGCTSIINLLRKQQNNLHKKQEDKEDLIKVACHNLARSHIMDLCEASKQSDSKTMNFLLSCGDPINKKKTIFGTFALLQAIKAFEHSRNIEPVHMLILSGADINQQDTNGWTVLHHACQKGLKQVLEQIFKIWAEGKTKKILLNKLTNKNYHILHLAALNNHPAIIEYLLTSPHPQKLQINPNAVDGDKCTMLHHAAKKGSLQALKKVLQFAPSLLYECDVRSNTALHYAAMTDQISCIKHLLYFDSDNDRIAKMPNTRGKLAKDLTLNKKHFQSVFLAAKSGDVNQVRKMLSQTPTLKSQITPTKQRSLLIFAVINQHLLVVKFLTELGVDQSLKDTFDRSAKQYAEQALKSAKTKQQQVQAKNIISLLV